MDALFSSDSSQTQLTKTSTSSGGPLSSQETLKFDTALLRNTILNKKRVYTDDTGDVYLYIYDGNVFIDTQLDGPFTLSTYKHWIKVRDILEGQLKTKGINEYFTLVDSQEKFRWCEFIGMETANVLLGDTIELMVRHGY